VPWNILWPKLSSKARRREAQPGKTAMFVRVDDMLAGIVLVADPIKGSTARAIKELHAHRLRVIIATGDNERTAQAVASSASTRCGRACFPKIKKR
jgi:Cu+-exporting ATPase